MLVIENDDSAIDGKREEWEGTDPRYCIEELQLRTDLPIQDDAMVLVTYSQEVAR